MTKCSLANKTSLFRRGIQSDINMFHICLFQVFADFYGKQIRNIAAEDPITFAYSSHYPDVRELALQYRNSFFGEFTVSLTHEAFCKLHCKLPNPGRLIRIPLSKEVESVV